MRNGRGPGAAEVKGLEEAIRYLEEQAEWIGDQAAWKAAGYPVGGGLVERAGAVVINARLQRRGVGGGARTRTRCSRCESRA